MYKASTCQLTSPQKSATLSPPPPHCATLAPFANDRASDQYNIMIYALASTNIGEKQRVVLWCALHGTAVYAWC